IIESGNSVLIYFLGFEPIHQVGERVGQIDRLVARSRDLLGQSRHRIGLSPFLDQIDQNKLTSRPRYRLLKRRRCFIRESTFKEFFVYITDWPDARKQNASR